MTLRESVTQFENSLIDEALEKTGGHKTKAAKLLGMNRTTLVEKLRKRGLIQKFKPKRMTFRDKIKSDQEYKKRMEELKSKKFVPTE